MGYSYSGVSQASRQLIDTMCNGEFLDKSPSDSWENLEKLAENNQSWDYSDPFERSKINNLSDSLTSFQSLEKSDLHKKVDQLIRKMDAFELSESSGIAEVATYEEQCAICDQNGHLTRNCLGLPTVKETLQGLGQAEVNAVNQRYDPLSNTYNPGTKDHPAFRRGNQTQAPPPRPPKYAPN